MDYKEYKEQQQEEENKVELVSYEGTLVHPCHVDWLMSEKEMNYGYTKY